MTDRTLTWVVGGGGLLGSAVRAAIPTELQYRQRGAIEWRDAAIAARQLSAEASRLASEAAGGSWAVAWCAGAGVIGTSIADLEKESHLLSHLLDSPALESNGSMFLASSAGGVYGGASDNPITEQTPAAPLSDYGRSKLTQESLVGRWAARTGGRAVIGRVSNLYGPGQSLTKRQGLISQVCLSALTRQPVSIYVSLDTIRDYFLASDCGDLVRDLLSRAETLDPGQTTVKIVASHHSISIGGVLAEVRRVHGRACPMVMASSPNRRLQGSALSFRSVVWADLDRRPVTPLPVGIDRTLRHLHEQIRRGR